MQKSNALKTETPVGGESRPFELSKKAKIERVREALALDPYFSRAKMAADLGLSRPTVYSWVARILAGQTIRPRGRRAIYAERSRTVTIRVPESFPIQAIIALRRKVREYVMEIADAGA